MIISGDRSRLAQNRRIDSASIPKEGCILPEVDILQLFYLTAGSSPVSFVGDPALLGSSAFRFNLERQWRVNPELLLVGPKIGECRYGKVHEGKYLEQPVAIKVITEGKTPEEIARREARFNREVSLLSRFQHKNIVKFLGACKRPVMVIVTELLCGGSLRKHLMSLRPKRLDLYVALSYALDIAKAMECLHMNGIIHRDLKPENILLTSDLGSLKLADFGLAREETLEMMTSETGTYRWMAPELYSTVTLRHGEKKHYNHKVDVYSFSILLWELLTNRMPFEGMSNLQAAYAAAFKGARPTVGESLNVPEKIVSILKSCWAEDPNIRPNFSQIVGMIESYLSTFPENKKTMWSSEEKQESAKEVSDSNLLNKPRLGFSSCFGQCSSGR